MAGQEDGVQAGGLEQVDVGEAARRLQTTPAAIRTRIRRSTLRAATQDGRGSVLMDPSSTELVAVNAALSRVLEESRRLTEQNVQLAGPVGFLQAQLQAAQSRGSKSHRQAAMLEPSGSRSTGGSYALESGGLPPCHRRPWAIVG